MPQCRRTRKEVISRNAPGHILDGEAPRSLANPPSVPFLGRAPDVHSDFGSGRGWPAGNMTPSGDGENMWGKLGTSATPAPQWDASSLDLSPGYNLQSSAKSSISTRTPTSHVVVTATCESESTPQDKRWRGHHLHTWTGLL